MIDNYLLEYLVTFTKVQTLAKTAAELNVTQPTVTRGMQRLEEEFGVKLFDRQPNRITLTPTGKLAAKLVTKLLQDNQTLVTTVRNYDQTNRVVKVACSAPGPRILAEQLRGQISRPLQIWPKLMPPDQLLDGLRSRQFSMIISSREIQSDQVESIFLGQERLFVNLDQFMYLANQRSVTFKELRGISFVVLSDIGPWRKIVSDHIPDAKFLYQTDYDALRELTKYTNFPFFTTNITSEHGAEDYHIGDRVTLPITDPAATMTFYATYLKDQRDRLQPLIKDFTTNWPQ
ncbi:MAG: LysR family transcriptional regulator [Lactobacillaceae bacterium]|uniref:LysR family transcriptional regulator n=1 Tax=Limosilactobacillus sp. TaxID=2773925 RepID=UPI002A75EF48|nr:LysR family transcriptional regulator [Limosilactobacillus sp.]MDD7692974.1 LysR family transcriptional regulator [Lactobacillaceae bacterium]MDY2803583.1 LysR family transcriptional regulator [Limosilactobacillus sp.]